MVDVVKLEAADNTVTQTAEVVSKVGSTWFHYTFLGIDLWHLLVANLLFWMIFFLTWKLRQQMYRSVVEYMEGTPQKWDDTVVSFLQIAYRPIVFIGISACAYLFALVTASLTDALFKVDFALLIICIGQLTIIAINRFAGSGPRESTVNRHVIGNLSKYVVAALVLAGNLLLFNINFENNGSVAETNWYVSLFALGVFAPFLKNGGLSAVQFAFTHPARPSDLIQVDNGEILVFISATAYAVRVRELGSTKIVTMPMRSIVDKPIANLSKRGELEVRYAPPLSVKNTAQKRKEVENAVGRLFKGGGYENCKLRVCEMQAPRGAIEFVILYNIVLTRTGSVNEEVVDQRKNIRRNIDLLLEESGIILWEERSVIVAQ